MNQPISCFKAYDVRGRVPDQLNEDIAYRIGRAYASFLVPKSVVVGHDIRLDSPSLCNALSRGLLDSGVDVVHIGQCGTEEIYFATSDLKVDGGIVVTASHNPKDYNGMKFVRECSKPISGDSGLKQIQTLAERNQFAAVSQPGQLSRQDNSASYIKHLLSYVDIGQLRPLKVVCNAGNGGAGKIIDLLESQLPFEFIKVQHEANGEFPNGVPNPLIVENRASSIAAIKDSGADLGIAWDGDFDRCFFFDASGRFIEGYYIVGLLAEAFLSKPELKGQGSRIVHDPRLTWNSIEICESLGGVPVQSKTGHAFIKEIMREQDAVYGGEMSAHHYFKDFAYCDSGMIPWLLVTELMGKSGKSLAQLVDERMARFPVSGEINRQVADPKQVLAEIETDYADAAEQCDHTDGLSMSFGNWRFNLRASNTEPVIRLNVESRGDQALMESKTAELLKRLEAYLV